MTGQGTRSEEGVKDKERDAGVVHKLPEYKTENWLVCGLKKKQSICHEKHQNRHERLLLLKYLNSN